VIRQLPDCEGSGERVWATSEFQLGEGGLEVFDHFGSDDVGIPRWPRAFSGCQRYGGRHRDFERV
jgi:hypothetical protein